MTCLVCGSRRLYRRGFCQVDYRLALRGERRELTAEQRYRILQRDQAREALRKMLG